MIIGGKDIANLIKQGELFLPSSEPLTSQVRFDNGNRIMSYGVGPAGYDIRLGRKFAVLSCCSNGYSVRYEKMRTVNSGESKCAIVHVHPCNDHLWLYHSPLQHFALDCEHSVVKHQWVNAKHHYFDVDNDAVAILLEPGVSLLGESVEVFDMPDDVVGFCVGKSSYARCGILVNVTPIEPGWKGRLVIELVNLSHVPVLIHIGQGIAQVLFAKVLNAKQYSGHWQKQSGIEAMLSGQTDVEGGRWNWWGIPESIERKMKEDFGANS